MRVYYWPDGSWCEENDLPEMTHLGDDYCLQMISDNLISQEIDQLIHDILETQIYR